MKPTNNKTRRITFLLVQLLAIGAVVAAFIWRDFVDQHMAEYRLSGCLLHDVLHIYCPTCGGTRAVVALFRGQLLSSLAYHPLSLYLVVGFICFDVQTAIAIRKDSPHVLHIPNWYLWGMLIIAATVFIVRNYLLIVHGWDNLGDLLPFWHASSIKILT